MSNKANLKITHRPRLLRVGGGLGSVDLRPGVVLRVGGGLGSLDLRPGVHLCWCCVAGRFLAPSVSERK